MFVERASVRAESILCASSVLSVPLWFLRLLRIHHRGTENTEMHRDSETAKDPVHRRWLAEARQLCQIQSVSNLKLNGV